MKEWTINLISWIAVLSMFAYIAWRLADQFKPGRITIRAHPAPTWEYFERIDQERIFYKTHFKELDRILSE